MAIRLTKQEQKEQARLAEALREREAEVALQFALLLEALQKAPVPLNNAIRARNLIAKEAAEFVKQVHDRLEEEFEEKSEGWQEGDAGQAARDLIDEWDGVDIDEAGEVQIVEPEIEGDTGGSALAGLPGEPS